VQIAAQALRGILWKARVACALQWGARMKKLLLPSLAVLAAACSGPTTIVQKNDNNGDSKNLSFAVYDGAVGSSTRIEVSYVQKGPYSCTEHDSFDGPYEDCAFAGTTVNPSSLTAASCGQGCTATIDGLGVNVSVASAGTVKLQVTAQMDDGSSVNDSVDVKFVQVDTVAVGCTMGELCPGPHAIFVGAQFSYTIALLASGESINADISVSASPSGIVDVTTAGSVQAVAAGTAVITYSFGSLKQSVTVRVVNPSDAVSGEVHLLAASFSTFTATAASDAVGPLAPASRETYLPLVPVWKLSDGSTALGGAELVHAVSSNTGVELSTAQGLTAAPLWFTTGTTDGQVCQPGTIHVAATLGTATLDDSFSQTCP
jgi:hypothetical protein